MFVLDWLKAGFQYTKNTVNYLSGSDEALTQNPIFKRYYSNLSSFESLAFWYGSTFFWVQLPASLAVISSVYLVGAIFSSALAVVLPVVCAGIMLFAHLSLQTHYNQTKKRCKKIEKDMVAVKEGAQKNADDLKSAIGVQYDKIEEVEKKQTVINDCVEQFRVSDFGMIKKRLVDETDKTRICRKEVVEGKTQFINKATELGQAFDEAKTNMEKTTLCLREAGEGIALLVNKHVSQQNEITAQINDIKQRRDGFTGFLDTAQLEIDDIERQMTRMGINLDDEPSDIFSAKAG